MFRQDGQYFLANTDFDLHPICFGQRVCTPGYTRKSSVDRYYIIHYIVTGNGVFFVSDEKYELRPNQIIITSPGQVYRFHADADDPMHYIFIKFCGSTAQKTESLPRVLPIDGAPLINIINCNKESNTAEEYITAQLYLLFSQLFEVSQKKNDYITIIKNFISANRDSNITVENVCNLVNLNRQYVSALFKKETGITIQQYMIAMRIEKAKLLLKQQISVTETAMDCGYESVYSFSKSFKRVVGITPSEFQKISR
jgi:AraC-like DNA-binding protein